MTHIKFPNDQIVAFCKRWKIHEFALFGSVLRDDFDPDSDVDVLVTFEPEATWSLFDLVEMKDELESLFRRSVHLVEKPALRNPSHRHAILKHQEIVYAAA